MRNRFDGARCLVSRLFVVVTNITKDRMAISYYTPWLHSAAVAKIVYSTAFRRGVRLTRVPRHVRICQNLIKVNVKRNVKTHIKTHHFTGMAVSRPV